MIVTLPTNEVEDLRTGLRRWVFVNDIGGVTITDGRVFLRGRVTHVFQGVGTLAPHLVPMAGDPPKPKPVPA